MNQRFAYSLLFLGIALVLGLVVWMLPQVLSRMDTAPIASEVSSASSASTVLPEVSSSNNSSQTSADSSAVSSSAQAAPELTDAIMGKSIISADTMAALYKEHGAEYPASVYAQAGATTIEEFCTLCVEEAEAEGVRAEVLFAQAMHETAWLQFGNQVSVEQNNFGGLGAVNSGGAGESFASVREGLRAQVQHLKAYASSEELVNECIDPRFDLVERGSASTVFDLGGRWAWPGDGYGDAIMAVIKDLYVLEYGKTSSE